MPRLYIQIKTADCQGDDVYIHRVPEDTDKAKLLEAIAVLYGSQDVISIYLEIEDDVEDTA